MASILEHALLGVSVVALGTAGSRAGAALGARSLPRLLAAAPLAATAAAIEVLALGLVDLGSDPVALTFAALTTSLLAAWLLPRPQRRLVDELVHGWRDISSTIRIAAAAAAGALAALTIWFLANPAQVADGLVYHLPVVVAWVDGGDPPSLVPVGIDAPVEAYPLTNELLLTWAVGISRGFAAATVWTPAMLTLLALAAWAGLRRLEVPELVAGLAVAALVTTPLLVRPLNSTETEIPAMAWLVCCAALCVWSLRTPGMLIPAVCAAALAIGTKTTAAPLALACVIAALVAVRARLRPLAWMLAATGLAAAVVGGLWYARNLILHGSPLWPFVTTPWGDALPLAFESTNGRLLWDPSSAQGRLDDYARFLYGALVLLAGGLLAPLLVRTRRVLAASAATALATLIWANAPYTALPADPVFDGLQAGATRYLVPAMAAGALALALAGSGRVAGSDLAKALLAGALLANLTGIATLGVIGEYEPAAALEPDPILPTAAVPLAGAVLGGAVAVLLSRARRGEQQRPGWWPVLGRMGWIVGAVLAGALLAIPDSGYVERSTRLSSSPAGAEWLVRQERYVEHDDPVAMQNRTVATLAGDRLSHRLNLIPAHPECSQLQDAVHEGWTVLPVPGPSVAEDGLVVPGLDLRERRVRAGELAAARCLAGRDPAYDDGKLRIYAPDRGG